MNPIWKVYKSKVLKTLNPDLEEYAEEEVENKKLIFHLQISPTDVLLCDLKGTTNPKSALLL